jgi:hypothetical protein
MTERGAEHPVAGQEDRLEAARDQGVDAGPAEDRRRAQG